MHGSLAQKKTTLAQSDSFNLEAVDQSKNPEDFSADEKEAEAAKVRQA